MSSEYPPCRSFFIGRWQPLHKGHIAIIRRALDEGREVVVGIMDTPESARNPYSLRQRHIMFRSAFSAEFATGRIRVLYMPWVDEVCHGRNVGWRVRKIRVAPKIAAISGTAIRAAGAR